MNKHIDFDLETAEAVTSPRMKRAEGVLKRQPLRAIGIRRLMRGGRLNDAGRLPRYALTLFLGLGAIWAPVAAYLALSPKGYSAGATLILPGAGSNASVNLSEIGQASSSAASPFSSSAVSPTVTYKALLASARVRAAAAEALGVAYTDLPEPRVRLTDQTSLIRFDVKSGAPENAALAAEAVLAAFLAELDKLRSDEIARREDGFRAAIGEYKASVDRTRTAITRLKEESGLLSVAQYERLVEEADALALRVLGRDAHHLRARIERRERHRRVCLGGLDADPAGAAAEVEERARRVEPRRAQAGLHVGATHAVPPVAAVVGGGKLRHVLAGDLASGHGGEDTAPHEKRPGRRGVRPGLGCCGCPLRTSAVAL